MSEPPLEEDRDFYFENGLMVFTAEYLRRRGFCCRSGCRHCPYEFQNGTENTSEDKS